jgi:signal transduction histidine kinase
MSGASAEEALRRSEHRYHNLFQAMAASFWELDFFPVGDMLRDLRKQGVADYAAYFAQNPSFVREMMRATRVVDVNDQTVSLFGRGDKAELLGSVEPFWPEASSAVYATAVIYAVTGRPNFATETRLRAIDGREFDALFTACFPAETMNKGTLLIGVIDISARKEAEAKLARVQAEFAHAARVSILGELTASIAHEVNQPLAAIATNAAAGLRWLSREEPELDEARALLGRISADAGRAAQVIDRVRAMAGGRTPQQAPVQLNDVVQEALVFLRHDIEAHGVRLSLALDPAAPPVLGDRTQLQQVAVNLIVNALQAMDETDPARRELTISTLSTPAGAVSVRVQDAGPGLADPARVFDSFFTTKPTGMGMGLTICRSILEAHGGGIAAVNGPAAGAVVTFHVPTAASLEEPAHTNV